MMCTSGSEICDVVSRATRERLLEASQTKGEMDLWDTPSFVSLDMLRLIRLKFAKEEASVGEIASICMAGGEGRGEEFVNCSDTIRLSI